MSTYLDKQVQLPEYETTVPLDLMRQVGMMKQVKYDTNQQNIQDQLDKLGQFPIIKESDRQLIAGKMNDVVNQMNQFSGQDLGDKRVYNKLLGYTSGLMNDKDVYERIAANTAASTQLKKIQKTKDENPDEYSPDNEHVFMKSLNDWMSNPNKTSFQSTYTPYYNPKDEYNQIIDDVVKNPDIKYRVNPDGTRSMYSPQEIKEVTATKISQALQSRLSDRAKAQMGIEYQAALDKPQYSIYQAQAEVNSQLSTYDTNISQLQGALPGIKSKTLHDQTVAAIQSLQEEKDRVSQLQHTLTENGQNSDYYTYGKFVNDKLSGMAKAFAYRQEGELKYDALFMEDYKFRQRESLERLKQRHKLELKSMNEEPAAINTFQSSLEDLHVNNKAEFAPQQVYTMQNMIGKIHDDGSMDAMIGNKPQFLDMQPMLKAQGLDVPAQKVVGYNNAMTTYSKWIGTSAGQDTSIQHISGSNQGDFQTPDYDKKTTRPKSFDQYIQYLTKNNGPDGKPLVENFAKQYGWDIRSPQDLANVKKLTMDPNLIQGMSKVSTVLQENALRGSINLIPQDGTNTVTTSEGKPYNNFYAQMTKKDLNHIFGSHWFSTGGADLLIQNKLLKSTRRYAKDSDNKDNTSSDNEIFQIPISLPVTKDLGHSNAEIITNTKSMVKHAGVYEQGFNNSFGLMQYTKDVIQMAPEALGDSASKAIDKFVENNNLSLPKATQYKKSIQNAVGNIAGANAATAIQKRAILKAIATSPDLKTLEARVQGIMNASAPLKVTTKPTDYMSQDQDEE